MLNLHQFMPGAAVANTGRFFGKSTTNLAASSASFSASVSGSDHSPPISTVPLLFGFSVIFCGLRSRFST